MLRRSILLASPSPSTARTSTYGSVTVAPARRSSSSTASASTLPASPGATPSRHWPRVSLSTLWTFPARRERRNPGGVYDPILRRQLAAFLDAEDIRSTGLVGISMGGAVALGHALDGGSPGRVVLADSYGSVRTPTGVRQRARRCESRSRTTFCEGASPRVRACERSCSNSSGPRYPRNWSTTSSGPSPASPCALRSWQRREFRPDGLRTDYRPQLVGLTTPTLLVHGANDPLFSVSWSRDANARLSDGESKVFENCGHWAPRACPERFNRVVRNLCLA